MLLLRLLLIAGLGSGWVAGRAADDAALLVQVGKGHVVAVAVVDVPVLAQEGLGPGETVAAGLGPRWHLLLLLLLLDVAVADAVLLEKGAGCGR